MYIQMKIKTSSNINFSYENSDISQFDMDFLKSKNVQVNLYILNIRNIVKIDETSLSDPYLKITCGDYVINVHFNNNRKKINMQLTALLTMYLNATKSIL